MLVLTRKRSESIKIGNDIVIKVIQTSRGTVKLGIEAPAHVRVLRAELTEFATAEVPALVGGGDADAGRMESNNDGESDSTLEDDCYVEFNTEYAVEVEDQMLCVASD